MPKRIAVKDVVSKLERSGARLSLELPDGSRCGVGRNGPLASVRLREPAALAALLALDHFELARSYIRGAVDIDGDMLEVLKITDHLDLDASFSERLHHLFGMLARNRIRYQRESIAQHYDRPADFFLPWLGQLRCYSHGLYKSADQSLDDAMAAKHQAAIDALGLESGMRVLDMGAGWGCFIEYAGQRGIHVHGLTISRAQYDFVTRLIRERDLPCTVELVNFRSYQSLDRFDGAVFMGSFEHNPDYRRIARFLDRVLAPDARVWADFCAQRTNFITGRFLRRYLWQGPVTYVNPGRLVRDFLREGFNIHELTDDTRSYEYTVRDWADAFDRSAKTLTAEFGEEDVRSFRLFLRGSEHFLRSNRTQAYHFVAGRTPRERVEGQAGHSPDFEGSPKERFGPPH